MAKNYKALRQRVENRLNPDNITFQKSLNEDLSTISYSDILMYIRLAMNAVPPEYTAKSKEAGEMVKKHLREVLTEVFYRYQGSVMTDTHIKGVSDIDLLVMSNRFYRVNLVEIQRIINDYSLKQKIGQNKVMKLESEANTSVYSGNALQDLYNNRSESEKVLLDTYKICDITKPKAIKIKNLNLNREVDTVIANWYDNINSIVNGKGDNRGVQVYNKDEHEMGSVSYPFLSITKINDRSSLTNGRLKKMIRFMKNVKEDSDNDIKLNSCEINAICYDIGVTEYKDLNFYQLVGVVYNQLKSICLDSFHADRIISVDGTETIFRGKPEKVQHIRLILSEVEKIYFDLTRNRLAG